MREMSVGATARSSDVRPAGPTGVPPQRDPVVSAAPAGGWRTWFRSLVATAKGRLAGASALLLATLLLDAAALALFGHLADEVMEGETKAVDTSLFLYFRSIASPGLDELARLVSAMGSEVVGLLLVVLTAYFVMVRRYGAAASLVLVTAGAQLLNDVLKDFFRRPRPIESTSFIRAQVWSFPSGHAMVSAAFYLFLIYVGWRLLHGAARWVWAGVLVTLVLLIGLSRMYLGVHYLTDVIAGYAAGAAWTAAVIAAGRLLALRRGRYRPAPQTASISA